MTSMSDDRRETVHMEISDETRNQADATDWKMRRWLVSFRSGTSWYCVGEFIALDAAVAIERAIAVFGPAEEHGAEEIPWGVAPLPRLNPAARRASC